jgi:hypothetical protein
VSELSGAGFEPALWARIMMNLSLSLHSHC